MSNNSCEDTPYQKHVDQMYQFVRSLVKCLHSTQCSFPSRD